MGTAQQIAAQLKNLINPRSLTEAMTRSVLILEGDLKREVKVKSGGTRRTFTHRVEAGGTRGVAGSNSPIARYLHEGTGLYGPKKRRIVPTTKKALMWKGAAHPVRSVKGMRPDNYVERALARSKPGIERELEPWGVKVLSTVK